MVGNITFMISAVFDSLLTTCHH